MTKTEIMNFAIKGIEAEIRDYEETIKRYSGLIEDKKEGKPVATRKSISEIEEVIRMIKKEIEILDQKKFDLHWELSTNKALQ